MWKLSTLQPEEVNKRLQEMLSITDSLYYWANDQDIDTWMIYCNVLTNLKVLISEVEKNDR